MKPSPWNWNQKAVIAAMALAVCTVLLTIAPTVSAFSMDNGDRMGGDVSRMEAGRIAMDLSDGYVTDTDGFIGNGENDSPRNRAHIGRVDDGIVRDGDGLIGNRSGAFDMANEMDTVPDRDPVDPGTSGIDGTTGMNGMNGIGGTTGMNGMNGRAGETPTTPGDGNPSTGEQEAEESASNVLGWMIALIILVAVVLVVLALVPKKKNAGR